QLPEDLGSLSNLYELDLSFNKLDRIPQSIIGNQNIIKLNLGGNLLPDSIMQKLQRGYSS
ncbi:hypothetical protein, partial [Dyadobacter sp.]|uniref:hypothetical protein n=1 Tax=Dyadobacter sp. TaxID=1914288 RepID=UPI003F72D60D